MHKKPFDQEIKIPQNDLLVHVNSEKEDLS